MKREIIIAVHRVPELEKVIKRLARVAKKLKLSPLPAVAIDWNSKTSKERVRVISEEIDGAHGLREIAEKERKVEVLTVVSATLTLPETGAVQADGGWQFIGTLTRIDDGLETNALRAVDLPVLADFRVAGRMECDHCRAKRNRGKTLIIRDKDGSVKQVGRECAHFYLQDVSEILGTLEFQELVETLLPLGGEEDFEEDGWAGWSGAKVFASWPVDEVLPHVVSQVRREGYEKSRIESGGHSYPNDNATWRKVKETLQREPLAEPTAEDTALATDIHAVFPDFDTMPHSAEKLAIAEQYAIACDRVIRYRKEREAWEQIEPTAEDRERAASVLAWLEGLQVDATEDEFLANLQDIAQSGYCSERKLPLLAAVLSAKDRWDYAQRRAALIANRSTPAPEGRLWIEGTVVSVKSYEGDWGLVSKVLLDLDDGCRLYSSIPREIDVATIKAGQRMAFTATLKRSEDDVYFAIGSRPTLRKPKNKRARKLVRQEIANR